MTVILNPEVERAARERAERTGRTLDEVVNQVLGEQLLPPPQKASEGTLGPPIDEWERRLMAIGVEAGVSLTDEQVSREGIYED